MNRSSIINIVMILAAFLICSGLSGQTLAQSSSLAEMIERARNTGIEQSALDELHERAGRRGIEDQQLSEIIAAAVSLAEENLPADHLIQKTLEGLSKGVPDSRIVSFIDRMQHTTRQAARIVDPWLDNPDVGRMINSTEAGTPAGEIRFKLIRSSARAITQSFSISTIEQFLADISDETVLSRTTPSTIVAAINILPDLPFADQPELAQAFVVRTLKGGFTSGELQKLPSALAMAQQRSQLPAATILEGISGQISGGIPANQILQNLFNGHVGQEIRGNTPRGF